MSGKPRTESIPRPDDEGLEINEPDAQADGKDELSALPKLGILAIFAKGSRIDDMSTMNVSLPDDLKSFVAAQVSEGGYGSTSEYVRDLIRRDHDRRQLRAALLEGARSPATTTADIAYFASLRDQARAGD